MRNLDEIVAEATSLFNSVDDAVELEQVKARYLGKNGELTDLLKDLKINYIIGNKTDMLQKHHLLI